MIVIGEDHAGVGSQEMRERFTRCGEYRLGPADAHKLFETPYRYWIGRTRVKIIESLPQLERRSREGDRATNLVQVIDKPLRSATFEMWDTLSVLFPVEYIVEQDWEVGQKFVETLKLM